MSNGRAPVRRIQIGFGPSGATTTAKWCQLGNTAHIPFPPNGFASPVHLFSFPHSGTVQVILPLSLLLLLAVILPWTATRAQQLGHITHSKRSCQRRPGPRFPGIAHTPTKRHFYSIRLPHAWCDSGHPIGVRLKGELGSTTL
jgi:hypothetical protein